MPPGGSHPSRGSYIEQSSERGAAEGSPHEKKRGPVFTDTTPRCTEAYSTPRPARISHHQRVCGTMGVMGNKAECPACKAWTSGVRDAMDGVLGSCPHCGLSGAVIGEIYAAREKLADAELTAKYEAVLVRAGKAEAWVRLLRERLDEVEGAMGGWPRHREMLGAEEQAGNRGAP